jgi:hypothetical protein
MVPAYVLKISYLLVAFYDICYFLALTFSLYILPAGVPSRGDTIKYIYTNTQHKNPFCRVASIDFSISEKLDYDIEKYKDDT